MASFDPDVFGAPVKSGFDPDVFGAPQETPKVKAAPIPEAIPKVAPSKKLPSTLNVGINAGNEAVAAPIDALLNAPTNLWNLGKAAYGTAATALGRPDLAPDLTPNPDYARRLLERGGFIDEQNAPQTTGQRLLASGIKGGVGMAMNPSASVGQTAALMGSGALSGIAAQGTKEATGSDVAANSMAVLSPLAVAGATRLAQNKIADLKAQQSRNAPKDDALRAGLEAGYQVPPSMVQPTKTNQVIESIGGKIATQQEASTNNVQVTDKLARQALNLPPDAPLTPEVTQSVRREAFQRGYVPLENAGQVSTGKLYRQDLDKIVDQYQGAARSFPQAVRDDVSRMVDGLRRRSFDAGDAVKMSATLREDASKSFSTGDAALGKAQRAAAEAIENQIERGLGGTPQTAEMMQNFRDARQLMAKAHTVEDAIKVGTGSVDANKLAAALQRGEPLSGELKVAAEFANNFRKAVQTPQVVGSQGVSKAAALASMLAGGGGAAAFGPFGAVAGAVPFVAPPVARSVMLSGPYQRGISIMGKQLTNGLNQSYSPGMLETMLASNPQLSSGAALAPLLLTSKER